VRVVRSIGPDQEERSPAGRPQEGPPGVLAGPVGLDLSVIEAKELYVFLDGSIQNPHVRHQMWRSWGHCSRHAWAYVVADCELRLRPFQAAILYQGLTGRAARLLSRPLLPKASAARLLRGRGSCFTCDYGSVATPDPEYEPIARWVNRRRVVGAWLEETRPVWEPRSCPFCLGGEGLVCRTHVLSGRPWNRHRTATGLRELEGRLQTLVRSMTWKGPAATRDDRASVVEALGWFARWGPAAAIATEASGGAPAGRARPQLRRVQ
jgi:hypothetical protein